MFWNKNKTDEVEENIERTGDNCNWKKGKEKEEGKRI